MALIFLRVLNPMPKSHWLFLLIGIRFCLCIMVSILDPMTKYTMAHALNESTSKAKINIFWRFFFLHFPKLHFLWIDFRILWKRYPATFCCQKDKWCDGKNQDMLWICILMREPGLYYCWDFFSFFFFR